MSKALVLQVNIPGRIVKNPSTMAYAPNIYNLSNKEVKEYANRIGADYVCITDDHYYPDTHPVWQKCAVFSDDYKEYDTIIHVDSDYMFHDMSPNILDAIEGDPHNFYVALEITEKDTIKWFRGDTPKEVWNINTGLFIIRRPLIEEIGDKWKWYWDEYREGRRKGKCGEQDAIRDMMHDLFLDQTRFLNKNWNGGKAIKRPLFGLHYCAMRKMDFTEDNHKRAVQNKYERLSQMTQQEIESLYWH